MDRAANHHRLAALGQETRFSIYQRIAKTGSDGINAGTLAAEVGVPHNLLSYHMKPLVLTELVVSERKGREVSYNLNKAALAELAEVFGEIAKMLE